MQRAASEALPAGFAYEWTGITYQELKAGSTATIVFVLAMVFVFLVLAAQYESWSMPLMVILRCRSPCSARCWRSGCEAWSSTSTRRSAWSC